MAAISIIVPVYKVQPYLHRCVDSILGQTFRDFELILVDDGSPDGCPAICDDYARQDERIVVIHQKNGGLSAARNAGLDCAKGEYIAFIDSDDWVHPEYLQRLYQALVEAQADLSLCSLQTVCADPSDPRHNHPVPLPSEILNQQDMVLKMTQPDSWRYVIACCKLYRRRIFDLLRYPVGFQHEDAALWHHVIAACSRIVCISDPLYFYYQHSTSIMGAPYSIRRTDLIPALAGRIVFSHQQAWYALETFTIAWMVDELLKRYHTFPRSSDNLLYLKRMDAALRTALPLILKCASVTRTQKCHLIALRFFPSCYAALRRWKSHA